MTGDERRADMIRRICDSPKPISGTALAELYNVSRQAVVQDIALMRASGYDIMSTNRGYILQKPSKSIKRTFKVYHTDEQMEDELCAIVDQGGCVENVSVNHKVYGRITAELNINSRRKVLEFVDDIKSGKSSPLKNVTSGYHYHEVSADREETLDLIEQVLRDRGYLVD